MKYVHNTPSSKLSQCIFGVQNSPILTSELATTKTNSSPSGGAVVNAQNALHVWKSRKKKKKVALGSKFSKNKCISVVEDFSSMPAQVILELQTKIHYNPFDFNDVKLSPSA